MSGPLAEPDLSPDTEVIAYRHGYEGLLRGDSIVVDDAALLQALPRMEERKLISAEWGITKNGRRARYYKLTTTGRTFLRAESERLVDHFDALTSVLETKKA